MRWSLLSAMHGLFVAEFVTRTGARCWRPGFKPNPYGALQKQSANIRLDNGARMLLVIGSTGANNRSSG